MILVNIYNNTHGLPVGIIGITDKDKIRYG